MGSLVGGGGDPYHIPPEVVEKADPSNYDDLIGTGPFILTEYVRGSHFVYARNPDYWRTTTINGKEYPIPFVDELVMPLIGDLATAVSALRTGTLDIHMRILPPDVESLARTCPELLKAPGTGGNAFVISLRTDHEPLDDVNVRRALMIGTDTQTIFKAVLLEGLDYCWPIAPGAPGHIPLEDLPASTQELFTYDPVEARRLLALAGYPDGFTIEMHTSPRPDWLGIVEMVAGMWEEDLNVEVDIKTHEKVAFRGLLTSKDYYQSCVGHGSSFLPFTLLSTSFYTDGFRNYSQYSNPDFDELFDEAVVMFDPAKQTAMLEELFVIALDDAPNIPIGMDFWWTYWWPWVKNYYGESESSGPLPPIALMWLDQDLKAEMGFR